MTTKRSIHTAAVGNERGVLTIERGAALFEGENGLEIFVPLSNNWITVDDTVRLTNDPVELLIRAGKEGQYIVRTTVGALGALQELGLSTYRNGEEVISDA